MHNKCGALFKVSGKCSCLSCSPSSNAGVFGRFPDKRKASRMRSSMGWWSLGEFDSKMWKWGIWPGRHVSLFALSIVQPLIQACSSYRALCAVSAVAHNWLALSAPIHIDEMGNIADCKGKKIELCRNHCEPIKAISEYELIVISNQSEGLAHRLYRAHRAAPRGIPTQQIFLFLPPTPRRRSQIYAVFGEGTDVASKCVKNAACSGAPINFIGKEMPDQTPQLRTERLRIPKERPGKYLLFFVA